MRVGIAFDPSVWKLEESRQMAALALIPGGFSPVPQAALLTDTKLNTQPQKSGK